jgi:nucleotide-binding universal stress UspA family protein
MLKILLSTDGSEQSLRAVPHAIRLHRSNGPIELHVLNVQIPIQSGHARMFVNHEDLETYHQEEGEKALAATCKMLDEADIPYRKHIIVGHVADAIAQFAREQHCDQIMMGTHGRSALTHVLMGSVATDVIRASEVPVLLVK